MTKPYTLLIEVDDRSDHSSADDYYTEAEALATLPVAFIDGLRHADHMVIAYVDHYGGDEDMSQIARLYAQGYVPTAEDVPHLPEAPYSVATSNALVVYFDGEGGDSARICGPRVDPGVVAKDMVAIAVRAGEWDGRSQVIVYEEGAPTFVWAGE